MKAVYSLILLILATHLSAQSIDNYAIVYEKKLNMANLYSKYSQYYTGDNKFIKDEFKLTTNSEKSIYQKIENPEHDNDGYLSSYMTYSNTYIDIPNRKQVSQKEVGEKTFLLQDSLPRLQWYIHDETKEIAGYTCTKAMAKLGDSIIIVAYYASDLSASIGPESIGGLPGTILGMVIPRLHTTWLAKSVEKLELNPPKTFPIPSKGKPTNTAELYKIAKEAYKEYETVNSIVWRVIL